MTPGDRRPPTGRGSAPDRATVAALATAGMLGMAAAAVGILAAEVVQTRRRIGPRRTVPPYQDGRYGRGPGTSLVMAMLGDSGAAGLGVDHPADATAVLVARGVAEASGRTVVLTNHAVVGARTADLDAQVTRALVTRPHLAVIMIGANDVTHLVPSRRSAAQLAASVGRLRAAGTQVVVGTCPDLGTVQPIPQPLKWVARRMSRRLAARQALATVATGGRAVGLGDLLGPEFEARPEVMFSADRFHPSADGYAAAAHALLPSAVAALRLGPRGDLLPAPYVPPPPPRAVRAQVVTAPAAGPGPVPSPRPAPPRRPRSRGSAPRRPPAGRGR